jgi:hypothetical protein
MKNKTTFKDNKKLCITSGQGKFLSLAVLEFKLRACAYCAGTLPLKPCLQPFLLLG